RHLKTTIDVVQQNGQVHTYSGGTGARKASIIHVGSTIHAANHFDALVPVDPGRAGQPQRADSPILSPNYLSKAPDADPRILAQIKRSEQKGRAETPNYLDIAPAASPTILAQISRNSSLVNKDQRPVVFHPVRKAPLLLARTRRQAGIMNVKAGFRSLSQRILAFQFRR
ncbi:MAG: hypothetical protein ACI9BD_001148, partial [Candidatus Marinamargulisbacteria bacterium]